MDKKNMDFSMEQVMQLAKSPAGQQLLQLLQQQNQDQLQQAANLASRGDYKNAGQMLSGLLTDPKAQALLKALEDKNG